MASRLMIARIKPDREAEWRRLIEELTSNRRGEWAQSNRRHGVRRIALWMSSGGDGLQTAILCDGHRGQDWPEGLARSGEEFDRWLGSRLADLTLSVTEAERLADTGLRFGAWREWRRR